MHLAQKLLTNIQCSDSSRSFAKEVRALKMRSTVAAHWKLTTTNWEPSLKLILLQLQEKLPKNSASTILQSFGIWNKLERWKSSVSGCRMSWPQIKKKKNQCFEVSSSLILHNTTNHFLIGLWCVTKSGFYMTTGHDQLSGWTEKKFQSTSQNHTCTKKCHGHCLVVYCQSDPLQISESWQKHYLWEVCSVDWWDAPKAACLQPELVYRMAQFFSMIMPDHALYNQWFKNWMNWATKFCLIRHIHLLLSNQLPLLQASRQLFAGKTLSQPAEGRKMLYKSSRNPKAWLFML